MELDCFYARGAVRKEQMMIKFINAEWLKAFFEADKGKGRTTPIDSLLALIDDAPSIDIVRCKECRHRPVKEDADGKDYGFNIIAPNEAERCPCLGAWRTELFAAWL